MKACPFCAEQIQDEAIVCKHCRRDLTARQSHANVIAVGALLLVLGGAAWLVVGQRTLPTAQADPDAPHARVTYAKFLQVDKGQGLAEVSRLLGNADTVKPGEQRQGTIEIICTWSNADGSYLRATFLNEVLIKKEQSRLE